MTKQTTRRNFLTKGALVAGTTLMAGAISAPAIASGKRKLKMVMTWPKGFPGLGTAAADLARLIKGATDGRISIKLYGGGELVPPLESFDAVSSGTADIYHGAAYYWQRKNTAFSFFTTVPFGMTSPELLGWIRHGDGQKLWDELYAKHNLKPFLAGQSGVQMGGWFRKEINSVEDLKGLKMRIPGLGGSVMKKLGVSPIGLPGGEIFQALQSGTIDATEWVGPWNDLAMGFYKVAPYYYYPGFHEPASAFEGVFNKNVWESFSESDKKIIEACSAQAYTNNVSEFNAKNGQALNTLVNKHGVKLRKFNDELYHAFAKATKETIAEITASNPDAKKVYDSYSAWQSQASEWTKLSMTAYADQRTRAFDK